MPDDTNPEGSAAENSSLLRMAQEETDIVLAEPGTVITGLSSPDAARRPRGASGVRVIAEIAPAPPV